MKKNLHIMANSKLYPNKFVPDYARFLAENVPGAINDFSIFGDDYNIGSGFNYQLVEPSVFAMFSLALKSKGYEKIIFHSIPSRFCLLFLLFKIFSFSSVKKYMVLWGGEIHFLKKETLKEKLYHKFNAFFMYLMDGFITYIKDDFDLAVKLSGNEKAVWVNIQSVYPSNTIQFENDNNKNDNVRVLIGASALKGNRHKEIIDILAACQYCNTTEFIIPLSYGSKAYAEEVCDYAKKHLKGNIITLTEFMPIEEYSHLLSTINIALFMHDGQQGMGNIRNLLAFGANVYMKKESVSFKYCSDLGFKVYDIYSLDRISYHQDMSANIKFARTLFSKEKLIEQTHAFLAYA